MATMLLGEDHEVVRQGLRYLLEREPDFHIVGESGDGLETVLLAEQLRPDVLVIDLMMPGLHGLEAMRQIKQRVPQTAIVVLSMYDDLGYVLRAFRNGASAYVLKSASATHLVRAVRKALSGERYLSPPLSEAKLKAYSERSRGGKLDPYETLTTREREVLHMSAEGNTVPEIASRLYVSPRTVESHRANMMRKLGLENQTALVRYAVKRGILPLN